MKKMWQWLLSLSALLSRPGTGPASSWVVKSRAILLIAWPFFAICLIVLVMSHYILFEFRGIKAPDWLGLCGAVALVSFFGTLKPWFCLVVFGGEGLPKKVEP